MVRGLGDRDWLAGDVGVDADEETGEAKEEAEKGEHDQQGHGHAGTALLGAGGAHSVNPEATHDWDRSRELWEVEAWEWWRRWSGVFCVG